MFEFYQLTLSDFHADFLTEETDQLIFGLLATSRVEFVIYY